MLFAVINSVCCLATVTHRSSCWLISLYVLWTLRPRSRRRAVSPAVRRQPVAAAAATALARIVGVKRPVTTSSAATAAAAEAAVVALYGRRRHSESPAGMLCRE